MTKQEFLAMSLPYRLKIAEFNDDGKLTRIEDLCPSRFDDFVKQIYYKPILRPLSDLTKEIEHNGERFMPIDELNNICDDSLDRYNDYFDEENILDVDWFKEPFLIFQKLIEWHFAIELNDDDYIDVNSLKENPYK